MVARPAVTDLQATDLAVADLEVGEVAQVDAGTAEAHHSRSIRLP